MTASATTENPASALVADPQDPLPESNWVPRRWFAFLSLAAGFILAALSLANGGVGIGWIVSFLITGSVLYMIAPSGEQVLKGLAMVSALKSGINFRSSSNVTTPDGSATTTSTAQGPAAGPVKEAAE